MIGWGLQGLTVRYRWRGPLGGAHQRLAVDDVSLSVLEGERLAIIGESGSGKSTLLRAGLGLLPRASGTITLLGEDASTWSRARWTAARREVQLLFQDPRSMLNPNLPIGLMLRESASLHRPEQDPSALVAQGLHEVGLGGRHDALPGELSGGERRRAGLARVLMARPRLLVADEPTSGLDAALKASLLGLMLERVGSRCAVVMVSHDLPTVAWAADRVVVVQAGRVVDEFPATALRSPTEPRHPHTVALLRAAGLPTPPERSAPPPEVDAR